jgi:hypothetical protein
MLTALRGIHLAKKTSKKKSNKRRQSKKDRVISMESASMVFAMLTLTSNGEMLEHAVKLMLRGPDLLKGGLSTLMASQGQDVSQLMTEEPDTPASEAEVRAFVEPILQRSVEAATLARMVDIYLFSKEVSPENVLFAFYIMIRFVVAQEKEPTTLESKIIWVAAMELTRSSKIGAPHWAELENRGPRALEEWLEPIKASARKKYKTFLIRKKKLDASAGSIYNSLMSMMFKDPEETS